MIVGQTIEIRFRAGTSPPIADQLILKQGSINGTVNTVSGQIFVFQPTSVIVQGLNSITVITTNAKFENLTIGTVSVGQKVAVRGYLFKGTSAGTATLVATRVELLP